MKGRSIIMGLSALMLLGMVSSARSEGNNITQDGIWVVNNDKMGLDVYGRAQMVGVYEIVPDHFRDHHRIYLFQKEARLGFRGHYEDYKFDMQLAYGGEDANGSNTDLGLLDMVADVPVKPLGDDAVVKIGQFRVPYSREGLTDRGYTNYGDRSLNSLASGQTRDYGLAIMKTSPSHWTGTFGLFSGGGRDIPQRYLPERLGVPMMVARFGYNDGVDEDIYHVVGSDLNLKRTTKAAYINAMYMQDTLIGHSTVLNLRSSDKNLLIDPNYNPYIGAGPNKQAGAVTTWQRGNLYWVGADAVIRHPLGNGQALEGEAEFNYGGYQNRFGVIHIASGRVQGDYQFQPFEIGVRYAGLEYPKANYLASGQYFSPAMGSVIHEVTPSITWYHKGHNFKVVADAPTYLNMPLWDDNSGLGSYVFADQVGQVSVLGTAGNGTRRRTIPQFRLLCQYMF